MGLGACTAEGVPGSEGTPTPTAIATANPTPSETPTEEPAPQLPPKPAEMSQETEEGAIATVRYFIDAVNLAYETNDPSYFEDLQTKDCGPCNSIAVDLVDAAAANQHHQGYNLSLGKISKTGKAESGWYGVRIDVIEGPYEVFESDGSISDSKEKAETYTTTFALEFEEGQWRVKAYQT